MKMINDHAWQCRACGQVSDNALRLPQCGHNAGMRRVALAKDHADYERVATMRCAE